MPGKNLTRDEATARAALLDVTSYTVDLDLTQATEDGVKTFGSTTTIDFTCREPGSETWVDLDDADVHEITLNGTALDPAEVYADSRISLHGLQADNVLVVRADCPYSNSGEGLHHFVDPADGRVYLYSQMEVPDARRVFACFEQPDLKAPFVFNVTAPAHWKVVSNAPTPVPADNGDGTAVWAFPPTKPISTYITAVVAGDYYEVQAVYEGPNGAIPMGHFCRQSMKEYLDRDLDELELVTRQGFAFFEDAFGYPYPFEKFDQLYVPEYNMAGMENAGCVTIRDEYLFPSRQPKSLHEFRASVILHEMAHMWFGDLVTMRWWDDLWLNESFAEWACYHAEALATSYTDAWTGFTNARKQRGYRADQLPSTHPIATDMYDLHAVEVNFDMITYAKGAAVIKQLVAWVGLQPFLEGLRNYFHDHAYGNTEFTDLLTALEKSSGRELTGWAQEWLQTAGTNSLAPLFQVGADGTYTSFAVRQGAPADHPTLRRHRLGIGFYDLTEIDGATRLVRTDYVETDVAGALTEIPEIVGRRQPDLLLLNDTDLAFAKIRLDERSLATATAYLAQMDDSLARALIWSAAWDMTRDAEMTATAFVDLVLGNIASETDSWGISALPAYAAQAVTMYSAPKNRDALRARWERGLRNLLEHAAPDTDHQLDLRPVVRRDRAQRGRDRRPRAAARRVPHLRRSRGRPGPALGTGEQPGPARSRRRDPDRGGAGPGQHDHRQGEGRGGPGGRADHGGQAARLGAGDARPVGAQRDAEGRRALVHAGRAGRGARAVRRPLPRRRPRDLGPPRRPQGRDRAGVHLPAGPRLRRDAHAGRRLAGERRRDGQPGRRALRPRGPRRRRPRPRRPGEGRHRLISSSVEEVAQRPSRDR